MLKNRYAQIIFKSKGSLADGYFFINLTQFIKSKLTLSILTLGSVPLRKVLQISS